MEAGRLGGVVPLAFIPTGIIGIRLGASLGQFGGGVGVGGLVQACDDQVLGQRWVGADGLDRGGIEGPE